MVPGIEKTCWFVCQFQIAPTPVAVPRGIELKKPPGPAAPQPTRKAWRTALFVTLSLIPVGVVDTTSSATLLSCPFAELPSRLTFRSAARAAPPGQAMTIDIAAAMARPCRSMRFKRIIRLLPGVGPIEVRFFDRLEA